MTKLCHAILENANAFSVHVTGFKHKIYRWLCFAKMRDLVSGDGSRGLQQWKISVAISFPGCFVVGRIKKEFKIVLFLSVVGNRDVWCVACLFAKLVLFCFFHLRRRSWRHRYVNGSDEIDPLVVEQALLKCFKALWSAEFSVVWRLGDTNKWTFVWKAKALSCVKDETQRGTIDGYVFLL